MHIKNEKWLPAIILLAGLLLVLVACGGGGEATSAPRAEPTIAVEAGPTSEQPAAATSTLPAAPALAPTSTTEATVEPTAEPEVELDLSGLSSAENLNSYRSTTSITFKGTKAGKPIEESIEVRTEYTRDPEAKHDTMITSGTEVTASGTVEIYQAEGMQYVKFGDAWISSPMTDTTGLDTEGLITGSDMLKSTCGWKKAGKESLDGVQVEHWTLTKAGMDKCMLTSALFKEGELSDAGGDLYIAVDGKYVAKTTYFYEGKNLGLFGSTSSEAVVQEGRMEVSYTMSDVNQPFTIEIPDEAKEAAALPEDIPTPADAQGASSMFGMITFESASTAQQVADFYKAEMPKNGWTQTSADEFEGFYTFQFTKGSRTANFTITQSSDGGKTQVLIQIEGE